MKKFTFTINGNKYDVEIDAVEKTTADISVNGTSYQVTLEKDIKPVKTPMLTRKLAVPSTESSVTKTNKPLEAKGAGLIKSPLPGVILEVLVKEGDSIKIGDRLLIMEAMKMENNINSDKAGKVISIKVKNGDAVLEGEVLVEIGAN